MDVKHSSGGRKTPLAHRIPQCGPNGVNRLRGLLAPFLYLKTLRKIMKYDFNKCTKEQLVEYMSQRFSREDPNTSFDVNLIKILRTAEVKLRTRQEINNEIANIIRYQDWFSHGVVVELNKLCKEEHSG
jgi:hypothetical protein